MRQKVVIACGLVRDATTLLFDEPLTGLDPIGIRRMRETIVARAPRRRGDAAVVAPAAPGRGDVHPRDHHGPRPQDRRRHVRGAARRAPSSPTAGSSLEQIFLRVTGHDDPAGQPDVMLSASLYIIVVQREEPRARAAAAAARAALSDRRDRRRRLHLFQRLRAAARTRAPARPADGADGDAAGASAALLAPAPASPASRCCSPTARGWLLPVDSGLLDSPKPKSSSCFRRRCRAAQLLIHRMLRSQIGIAVRRGDCRPHGRRRSSGFTRLRIVVGAWIMLVTAKVYFTGVTLARARLRDRGRRGAPRRLAAARGAARGARRRRHRARCEPCAVAPPDGIARR